MSGLPAIDMYNYISILLLLPVCQWSLLLELRTDYQTITESCVSSKGSDQNQNQEYMYVHWELLKRTKVKSNFMPSMSNGDQKWDSPAEVHVHVHVCTVTTVPRTRFSHIEGRQVYIDISGLHQFLSLSNQCLRTSGYRDMYRTTHAQRHYSACMYIDKR